MPTTTNIWIGGCLALAGTALGLVASLAAGYIERRHQRAILLRTRYEEATTLLDVAKMWLLRLSQCRTLDEVQKTPPPSEIRHLVVLSLIYFPEFKIKATEYYNHMMEAYRLALSLSATDAKSPSGQDEWQVGAKMAEYWNRTGRPGDSLQKVSEALDGLVEEYAKKYARA